jgi:hypothetical protein
MRAERRFGCTARALACLRAPRQFPALYRRGVLGMPDQAQRSPWERHTHAG